MLFALNSSAIFCELEYQLGLYRIEYQSQQDQEDDTDYKDDGKE